MSGRREREREKRGRRVDGAGLVRVGLAHIEKRAVKAHDGRLDDG